MPKDKSSGKKLADMMYGNPEGAAFGVFPQMKSKRSRQDPEAAKNFPVDLARGVIAGAVGMPGDIESLARLPYELMTGNESPTILPTSEDVLKRIPFGSDTPASQFASGLGTLAGGSANIGAAPRMVKKGALAAARAGERMAEKVVPGIMERGGAGADILSGLAQGSRSQVIKPKGGNWLSGSVEKAVEPLKVRGLTQAQADELAARPTPIMMAREGVLSKNDEALNNWIDRNLTNYIKKEMATPEDPVRKLAEQGIIHAPSEQVGVNRYRAPDVRARLGTEQLGKSEAAKAWEDAADTAIAGQTVGKRKELATEDVYSHLYEPWMAKLDPNERVWAPMEGKLSEGLGFDHIIDVLREDVASGRIRPEQLNKVSMEQAVRRTYEYDQEMAKRMREAQIKATEGMPVYKEYPEGFRWVELAPPTYTPETLPPGFKLEQWDYKGNPAWSVVDEAGTTYNDAASSPDEALSKFAKSKEGSKALEDALKYEGDTMGHCVGGYCPDVMQGRSRIFSLRDAKGEPHVTVEVVPQQPQRFYDLPEDVRDEISDAAYDALRAVDDPKIWNPDGSRSYYGDEKLQSIQENLMRDWLKQNAGSLPQEIVQIKGKQNRAPKDEYLPFVQDFVKSGQWSDVGDLQNTGLYKLDKDFLGEATNRIPRGETSGMFLPHERQEMLLKAMESKLLPERGYITEQEYEDALRAVAGPPTPGPTIEFLREMAGMPPEGMAHGGRVHFSDNPDVMALELAKGGAVRMQAGGIPGFIGRGIKAASKALKPAKEKELALPPVLPRAPAKKKEEIRPYAQRMAQQMTGEFYRPNPKKSENVAGKSFSQFKMEKGLEHDIRPTREVVEPEVADIEKQLGMLKIGISGDTTIADKILHRAGPYELFDPSPQHGGPRYGLGGEGAWASNNPIAATVQKRINELSEAYGAPPLGQYMAMGPQGSNFAQHFADANLQAIDISAMTKSQIEQINRLIREGSEKSGPRPSFPGIEDKGSAYLHFAIDPELRKHFNDLMQKTSITEKLNLPDGRIILHAITEPELRDKEILNTGFSQMRLRSAFDPENLEASVHPTYSHVIPHEEGSALTRTKYLVPGELEFSDVLDYAKRHYRPRDMTRVFQTSTPRQIVDPQHIDEMKLYEELMKEYTGRKKGGAVHKAAGGEITADDLILEERKL